MVPKKMYVVMEGISNTVSKLICMEKNVDSYIKLALDYTRKKHSINTGWKLGLVLILQLADTRYFTRRLRSPFVLLERPTGTKGPHAACPFSPFFQNF